MCKNAKESYQDTNTTTRERARSKLDVPRLPKKAKGFEVARNPAAGSGYPLDLNPKP